MGIAYDCGQLIPPIRRRHNILNSNLEIFTDLRGHQGT